MVTARTTMDYIKPNLEIYGAALENYLKDLKNGGKSDYGVESVCHSIRSFLARCRPMQPHEITADVMADVSIVMENDGLVPSTITQALVHMGRFLLYLTGTNPYNEIDPNSKENWYVGHLGEFRFQEQLDSYLIYLRERHLTDNSIRRKKIHITICCRILAKEKNIFFVSQIDESCFWHLDELMKGISMEVSNAILFDLNEFVKWCCGNNILKQFKKRRRPLKEYMDSGQWREDYEADERGELPEWLLRGVLSEDGLYNMLEDVKRIKERAEKIVGEGK